MGIAGPDEKAIVDRLLELAVPGLAECYSDREFVHSRRLRSDGRIERVGISPRYAAIAALGIALLPAERQRTALVGDSVHDLVSRLVASDLTGIGDAALVCWAAAESGHPGLGRAIRRLTELDDGGPIPTVDASWVVSALAAVRDTAGLDGVGVVKDQFEQARKRLLSGRAELYPHLLGGDRGYRAHVGSFADQVYPIQALARAGGGEALAAAEALAARIVDAQGDAGQWWWHYDARTGGVVEGYPVYSVHQHAMAPMALFDLAGAGGTLHADAIRRGLAWMVRRPETTAPMIIDEAALTWRKVARGDPRKAVRGIRAVATRARPGARLAVLDRLYPARVVDHECRPYELGWLLYAWLFDRR
jgi:hypothetical protein